MFLPLFKRATNGALVPVMLVGCDTSGSFVLNLLHNKGTMVKV
jgi:hypothetical protein